MRKHFFLFLSLIFSMIALANDPLSVNISGPHKIFTNDQVKFTATVVGASTNDCVWSATGGNGSPASGTYTFTAPTAATTVTIFCSVSIGEGDDEITAEDSITVTIAEPQITISRDSLDLDSSYSSNGPNIITYTGDTDTAFIHRNGMGIPRDILALNIIIAPSDVDIQSFELTTSNPSSLYLYKNSSPLNLPYSKQSVKKVSALNTDLNGLHVWGEQCGTGFCVNLKINNNQKISLVYNVYGIGDDSFEFPSEIEAKKRKKKCPNLENNEWAYEIPENHLYYNCLAYAIKNPSMIGTNYFWCTDVLDPNPEYVYADKFVDHPLYNSYLTSVDTFGNQNGFFENSDVDAYFLDNFWGQDKAISVINPPFSSNNLLCGDIFYYSNFHAARKSVRNNGAYSSWNLLESKCGNDRILIHRPSQICGNEFGSISKIYYR